jgi:D-alanine-D-alanine ligase
VFNIAEGLRGPTRESQIPALLEARNIPVTFGDSLCLAVSLHKGHAKRIVQSMGVPTPRFAVAGDADFDFAGLDLRYPLFAKPVAEGTGTGVTARSRAKDADGLRTACLELLERFRQPVLVEEYLPGREFTVGIVGTGAAARAIGTMEVLLRDNADQGAYSYDNKDQYEERVDYVLADDPEARAAAAVALAAYRALECRDAGRIDIRSDDAGRPQFIEANPLAGLNPVHSDLPILCRKAGIGFDRLIADIVASAGTRIRAGDNG